jgi:uncharacterized BrkB/YihY/UPF0761 family membrane protein
VYGKTFALHFGRIKLNKAYKNRKKSARFKQRFLLKLLYKIVTILLQLLQLLIPYTSDWLCEPKEEKVY